MNNSGDDGVRDPGELRITLREDLLISVQSYRGRTCYVIEDAVQGRFYRVGLPEGVFLSLLDGSHTLRQAMAKAAAALGEEAFSEPEAMAILHWLVEAKLACPTGGSLPEAEFRQAGRRPFSPLALRLPIACPDRLLGSMLPWFEWLLTPSAVLLGGLAAGAAVWQVTTQWGLFCESFRTVVAPTYWPSLTFAWLLLKLLHETAHGLVCKKYGGTVDEAGVMLLWGVPLPYVDVTSSWSFRSKWPRIYTAAAGLYAELWVASLAALVWSQARPGVLSFFCVHLVAIAGAGTLLFNANPLMRFDGYYVLMDLVEMPNLDAYGRQFLGAMVRKWVWGQPAILPGRNRLERHFIGCYGLVSWAWRWMLCAGLTVLTLAMLPLDDAHVPILAAAILGLGGAWQFLRFVSAKSSHEKPGLARLLAAGGLAAIVAGLCLPCVPWPGGTTAPAVVDYWPLHVVRAYGPGFVREVRVRCGEAVCAGQVIAVTANDELESEMADLELAVQQSQLALRSCQAKQDAAGYQAEREKLEDLQHRLAQRRQQVDRLVVRAPAAGRIVTRQPESLAGRYLRAGDEIVAIGSEQAKELRVSVAQDDVARFLPRVGQPLAARIGEATIASRLSRVEPRASLTPPHPALSAAEGGPLAVRPQDPADGDRPERDKTGREPYELLAPRFAAQVVLSADQSLALGAGQRGQVALQPGEETLGAHGAKLALIWARDKVRQVRAVWQ